MISLVVVVLSREGCGDDIEWKQMGERTGKGKPKQESSKGKLARQLKENLTGHLKRKAGKESWNGKLKGKLERKTA